ncbi:MAG: hypothetical protein RL226_396 [Bacteroidota bacterium]
MKQLLTNISVLLGVILLGNFIYKRYFFEQDLRKYSPLIEQINAIAPTTDVVYLGESSNTTFRDDDVDKRSIAQFMGDQLPNLTVAQITQPAGHVGTYKALLSFLLARNTWKPRAVVITLNLRSFSPEWRCSNLENALQESLIMLRNNPPLINRMMLSFSYYSKHSEKENERCKESLWKEKLAFLDPELPYNNAAQWVKAIEKNDTLSWEVKELTAHYIRAYAFEIDTANNERIAAMEEIIAMLIERGINPVFHIVAENVDRLHELAGEPIANNTLRNADLLSRWLTDRNVSVVNNIALVRDEDFTDRHWTTEHYSEQGRHVLAQQLAMQLSSLLNTTFSATYPFSKRYKGEFFNDCEPNSDWGDSNTLTSQKALSGQFSSCIMVDQPYSITFEYPLAYLPEDRRNNIVFQFSYYGPAPKGALAIMQTTGDNAVFESASFGQHSDYISDWNTATITYQLNEEIIRGRTIKLYVHSENNVPFYCDDFSVVFH